MQSTQNSLKTVLTINEQILDKYTVTLVILSSDCTRQKEMEKSVLDSIKCALVVNINLYMYKAVLADNIRYTLIKIL